MDGHLFAQRMWDHVTETDKGLYFNFLPGWMPYLAETRVTLSQWPPQANEYPPKYERAKDVNVDDLEEDPDEEYSENISMISIGRYGAIHKNPDTANPSD